MVIVSCSHQPVLLSIAHVLPHIKWRASLGMHVNDPHYGLLTKLCAGSWDKELLAYSHLYWLP